MGQFFQKEWCRMAWLDLLNFTHNFIHIIYITTIYLSPEIMNDEKEEENLSLLAAANAEEDKGKNKISAMELGSDIDTKRKIVKHSKILYSMASYFTVFVLLTHLNWTFLSRNAWLIIGMFFTQSGFIITSITLYEYQKTGTIDVFGFYRKRIGRLIPSALLAIFAICMYCVAMQLFFPEKLNGIALYWLRMDMIWATFYGSNWQSIYKGDDYFAEYGQIPILRHFWSLAIEEQYYFIWPILMCAWIKLMPILLRLVLPNQMMSEKSEYRVVMSQK